MKIRSIAATALAVGVLFLAGCEDDPHNLTSEQRLAKLELLYQRGGQSATAMRSHGIEPSEQSCEDMWNGSGLKGRNEIYGPDVADENKVWQRQRHAAYINGCLGRKLDIGGIASPVPSQP